MSTEHKKLLRLWALGKATRQQILRCMELDRKCKIWPTERYNDTSMMDKARAAIAKATS